MDVVRAREGRALVGWILFAAVMLAIPIAGLILESRMTFVELLPPLNASLNATSAIFIFAGWRAIKARATAVHWKCMTAAIAFSALFLIFYLIRFSLTGSHRYPVGGWTKAAYLVILFSHMALAAAVPPLVLGAVWLAVKKRYEAHRRLVRWALPIWGYVSVTGVVIYLMLYHLAPMLQART